MITKMDGNEIKADDIRVDQMRRDMMGQDKFRWIGMRCDEIIWNEVCLSKAIFIVNWIAFRKD